MICIRFSIISKCAEKKRISFTTYTDLSSRPEVYAMVQKEVDASIRDLHPAEAEATDHDRTIHGAPLASEG